MQGQRCQPIPISCDQQVKLSALHRCKKALKFFFINVKCVNKVKQEAFEKCWAHSSLRAAVTLQFTRCRYCRTPAIAIAQAACDVHDNDDNDDNDNNDNA